MNRYRCDLCGCYLDPGEGRMCDECRSREKARAERSRRMQSFMHLDGQQYQFEMNGGQTNELI